MSIPPLLSAAHEILEEVKTATKGSFDIIPDPSCITLAPTHFETLYSHYGAQTLRDYNNYITKLVAVRKACAEALQALKKQGETILNESTAELLAITKFGIGECSELSALAHSKVIKRNLYPATQIHISEIHVQQDIAIETHTFHILGITEGVFLPLCRKHNWQLIPVLQALPPEAILLDSFLGIADRIENVRKNTSVFTRYIRNYNISIIRGGFFVERGKSEIARRADFDAKKIFQYVLDHDLLEYTSNPLSEFLARKAKIY